MLYKVVFRKFVDSWFYLLNLFFGGGAKLIELKVYLRGKGSTDECKELFEEYKSCLNVSICIVFATVQ